jgi:hypothetical protein
MTGDLMYEWRSAEPQGTIPVESQRIGRTTIKEMGRGSVGMV